MNIYPTILTLSLLVLVQPYSVTNARSKFWVSGAIRDTSVQRIKKEEVIAIAKKHALKGYKSLKRFSVVACELNIFWRVIFDGGGPEYVIDKESGAVRRVQLIAQDWPRQPEAGSPGKVLMISRDEAIQIAKRDAESVPGIDIERFMILACELQRVWRIFVEPKLYLEPGVVHPIIPHSSAPNYVIDKRTGKILFKQR